YLQYKRKSIPKEGDSMNCRRCGNKEFLEGIQYMKIKESKFSLKGSEVKYIFCKKCGLVKNIEVIEAYNFK
ncbi:hypothetical protein O0A14_12270, partial [Staphylococcus pseudintermedius]|nr:hypothetical protein [Staphylococcus pseudintermedius]